ncbi:MAG: alginate lyase family protein [Nannocystaceae bacterium]
MVSPLTFLRTIRHLRPRQVTGQIAHRLAGPAQTPETISAHGCTGLAVDRVWGAPSGEGAAIDGGQRAALLGAPPYDPRAAGWQPEGRDPLWLYTLHYHGWINHPAANPDEIRGLLLHWIEHHRAGTGWEPYPTATRILHWLGWLVRHEGIVIGNQRRFVFSSLAAQLGHLERHLERHLDGNHLWTNLCALVTAGLVLDGPYPEQVGVRWLGPLVECVADQLAADGGHRERTPSYHGLLAEQLLGVVRALELRPSGPPSLAVALAEASARMIRVVPAFTHPDGDVALFGDSQLGLATGPRGLYQRAGLPLPEGHADAADSGFFRRAWGPWSVLWNAGGLGLPHQVGHIHGDALSFELSLDGERVLVDAGVGTYVIGDDRDYARSTRAHNTVTVGEGDPDQHELWASHRIGGRGRVSQDEAGDARLGGRVLGFRAQAEHRRTLSWHGGALRCHDTILGDAPARARFHVPASASVTAIDGGFEVESAGGRRFRITAEPACAWEQAPARGWTAMGQAAPRIALTTRLPPGGATFSFTAA